MERCPAQAAQEKPQLLIFLRPKDISGYLNSNDALKKTIGRIDNKEKKIQNLTESMRKSQKAIDI